MRSGSTLLQHVLGQHSELRSFSDLNSFPILAKVLVGARIPYNFCLKPMDLFYLIDKLDLYSHFNKFIWIARDPRDSYLSTIKSGYAYLFYKRGRREDHIDTGLLKRWKRVYRQYFENQPVWHLIKYEELVTQPQPLLEQVLAYLGLDCEPLLPFKRFRFISGGDYKIRHTSNVNSNSIQKYKKELSVSQMEVFKRYLAAEMEALGYE
jgi:hypothetical protein